MELKAYDYFGERKRYRLVRKLGSGGFSEVWLAEDTKANNMEVALKVYASAGGLDEEGIAMFSNEFSLLFNMNHSNLLKPTHFDDFENRPYLAIPFCKNGSAHKLIGRMEEADAWRFLRDVASGLKYLHGLNPPVIHQDISTENVLINENGDFLITDFGISTKARNTLRRNAINLQQSQEGGKVDFMAPELFGAKNDPIKASDIWAFGVTMYELLEGRLPFPQGLGGLALKGGADIPEISGNYSQELKNIVYKMLAKETWDRPTAEAIIEATIETHTPPPPPPKKSKIWIVIAVVAIIAAGVAGVVAFYNPAQPTETPVRTVKDEFFDLHGRQFTYTGDINSDGLPHGRGKATYEAGEVETEKGMVQETACVYEGRFENGYREKRGEITWENGDKYVGTFVKDYLQGKGTYYFATEYFDGNFDNYDMGDGIYYNNNKVPTDNYLNGKRIKIQRE